MSPAGASDSHASEEKIGRGQDTIDLSELLPGSVRSGLKRLIRIPERVLHPWRRRRARERLREVAPYARTVLFVCHGNICRSPFAERAFEAAIPDSVRGRIQVRSTGFHPEEGRSPPGEAVRAATKLDVDVSDHRSRSLISGQAATDHEIDTRSVVFVMEPGQRMKYHRETAVPARAVFVLGDFDPEPVAQRGIQDPFGHPADVFTKTFARIRRCVDELVAALEREDEPGGSAAGTAYPGPSGNPGR